MTRSIRSVRSPQSCWRPFLGPPPAGPGPALGIPPDLVLVGWNEGRAGGCCFGNPPDVETGEFGPGRAPLGFAGGREEVTPTVGVGPVPGLTECGPVPERTGVGPLPVRLLPPGWPGPPNPPLPFTDPGAPTGAGL